MLCPYCNGEMIQGRINTPAGGGTIFFKGNDEKRYLVDALNGEGHLPFETGFVHYKIKAHKCENCKKIIIDLDE